MVKDFKVTEDPKEIAFYAGFVSSSFAVGEFLSGVPWGMLSDRIGRKPVIMLGLFGTFVSMFAFGLSKSLIWAIVARFLSGALNGNIGVLKSMVGEMTDRSNRAVAFSYMSMVFGLGSILGPALGGFLSHPVENFPFLFSGNKFLTEYPYFLPCGICCGFDVVGIVFAHIYLEETLNKPGVISTPDSHLSSAPLLVPSSSEATLYGSFSTLEPALDPIPNYLTSEPAVKQSSISEATWYVIISYIGLSLMIVMIDELFPFWAATPIRFGGLGYFPRDIGLVASIMGVLLVLIQIFIYPSLQLRFSSLKLYSFSLILFVPVVCSLPLVSLLVANGFIRISWWVLVFIMGLRIFCAILAFTSHNIMLPESCENKNILGQVNGIAQSLGSMMRGIGPSLCGALWSWSLSNGLSFPFDYHLTFYVIAVFSALTYFLVIRIRPETLIH